MSVEDALQHTPSENLRSGIGRQRIRILVEPRAGRGNISCQIGASLGKRSFGFSSRDVDERRAVVEGPSPHLVHLAVDLCPRTGRLPVELVRGAASFDCGLFGESPGGTDGILPLLDNGQQRPEEQTVKDQRQQQNKENDPEDREIR
jgi:hypothetical protein